MVIAPFEIKFFGEEGDSDHYDTLVVSFNNSDADDDPKTFGAHLVKAFQNQDRFKGGVKRFNSVIGIDSLDRSTWKMRTLIDTTIWNDSTKILTPVDGTSIDVDSANFVLIIGNVEAMFNDRTGIRTDWQTHPLSGAKTLTSNKYRKRGTVILDYVIWQVDERRVYSWGSNTFSPIPRRLNNHDTVWEDAGDKGAKFIAIRSNLDAVRR